MKMLKYIFPLVLVSLLPGIDLLAQKVKYKDLVVLLTSKQYEKAEPFLKRYIKENDDNPNAHLYMGIVFQEKAAALDPLLNAPVVCSTIDSASIFYDKAY